MLHWSQATLAKVGEEDAATVISVDGVGAFDHVSRAAMCEGLRCGSRLATLIPFVRQFYGQDSSYLFYDASGHAHEVLQTEGGEQGDLA